MPRSIKTFISLALFIVLIHSFMLKMVWKSTVARVQKIWLRVLLHCYWPILFVDLFGGIPNLSGFK
jgi:hypothetical protein